MPPKIILSKKGRGCKVFFKEICNSEQRILLDTLYDALGDGMQDFKWIFCGDWEPELDSLEFDYYGREPSFDFKDPSVHVEVDLYWKQGLKKSQFRIDGRVIEYSRDTGPETLGEDFADRILRAFEKKAGKPA